MLQIVPEPNTGQCADEKAEPRRGWTQGGVPARTLGPEGRVDWRVPHRLKKGMSAREDV